MSEVDLDSLNFRIERALARLEDLKKLNAPDQVIKNEEELIEKLRAIRTAMLN